MQTNKKDTFKIYRYWIMLDRDQRPWSYIGYTGQSLNRRAGGLTGVNYIMWDSKFGFAIETYGWNNFQREIIEDGLTEEEAWEREKYYIKKFNSIEHGWNTAEGGKGTLGVYLSEETKKKISESLKGKHRSEETKKKMAESQGVFGVRQYDLNGNLIKEYPSISEASRQTGISDGHICDCLKGRYKTAGKSVWKYKLD